MKHRFDLSSSHEASGQDLIVPINSIHSDFLKKLSKYIDQPSLSKDNLIKMIDEEETLTNHQKKSLKELSEQSNNLFVKDIKAPHLKSHNFEDISFLKNREPSKHYSLSSQLLKNELQPTQTKTRLAEKETTWSLSFWNPICGCTKNEKFKYEVDESVKNLKIDLNM